MTTITATSTSVDQLLLNRAEQAHADLNNHFLDMDPKSRADWDAVIDKKEAMITADFAEQQNFIIQHHLAKTILSTT